MVGLIPRDGEIISFVGVGLARGPAIFADTQDPPLPNRAGQIPAGRYLDGGSIGRCGLGRGGFWRKEDIDSV